MPPSGRFIAVFFYQGGASETCIGNWWYQAYSGGEWWNQSHGEPFLLRSYCGSPEKLAAQVALMLQGREVVVTCMIDGNKEDLHQRRGKIQRLKASPYNLAGRYNDDPAGEGAAATRALEASEARRGALHTPLLRRRRSRLRRRRPRSRLARRHARGDVRGRRGAARGRRQAVVLRNRAPGGNLGDVLSVR